MEKCFVLELGESARDCAGTVRVTDCHEVVVVMEADPNHGASSLDELHVELEQLQPGERAVCEAASLATDLLECP